MKLGLTGTGVLALAGLAVAGYAAWRVAKAAGPVTDALNAVNPFNHDNVFATAVNDVGGSVITNPSGPGKNADGSWSLGGFIYDVTHPGAPTWGDDPFGTTVSTGVGPGTAVTDGQTITWGY